MWRTARRLALTSVAAVAIAGPAQAQDRPVTVFVAGAVTAPLSGTADHFNPGFGAAAGAQWNLGEQSAVRVDYAWSTLRPKSLPPDLAPASFGIDASVQYGTATFVFQGPPGRTRLYVLAGGGVYHRVVTVSGGGTSPVSVCNPWWFVCGQDVVPASRIAGTSSTTNVGVNVGLGLVVGRAFAEVRYHYAAGPSFDTPGGSTPATGKFFPLFVGVRF